MRALGQARGGLAVKCLGSDHSFVSPSRRRLHRHPTRKSNKSCLPQNRTGKLLIASSSSTISSIDSKFGSKYFEQDQRPIILFDGVCNLCNGGVNFMLDWDTSGAYRFAALQSQAGMDLLQRSGRSPTDISSIVLVEENTSYIKSEAILRIALRLGIPFPILASLGLLFPLGFRDVVYDGVANNRYSFFGKTEACRLGDDRFLDRFVQ